MELIKINPSEFGLTDETAKNIQLQFEPMLQKMVELEEEFNAVMALPIEAPGTAEKAKSVRLKYVKARTATAEIHKAQKAFYLNGGRFVDGWKNAQTFTAQGKEDALQQIESYFELKERARIEALSNERKEQVRQYVDDPELSNYGMMSEDVWQAFLMGKKRQYQDMQDAKEAAEQQRIEEEKAAAAAREAERIENERVRAEAQRLEKELSEQRAAVAKLEAEARAAAAKLKAEAAEMAKAPIKKQLKAWVDTFHIPVSDIESEKRVLIQQKFEAFKAWAKSEIEAI